VGISGCVLDACSSEQKQEKGCCRDGDEHNKTGNRSLFKCLNVFFSSFTIRLLFMSLLI
jgi:hypothetical protein